MNSPSLSVVMYHYVRDLKHSKYPAIKGLDIGSFKEQIIYLKKHYNFVTVEQVIDAHYNGTKLPSKAVLLTFDDGYIDHFTNVFPVLYDNGIQGAFYAPVKAITEHRVLDVNKIHYILAAANITSLIKEAEYLLNKYREEYNLLSFDYYFNKLAIANRFDSKEVIFLKRLLQVELAEGIRSKIINDLFLAIVKMDDEIFSRELYMSKDQLKCMISCGMHVGSHGFDHYWLGSLTKEQQRIEIVKSIEFIESIGGNIKQWTICYPYGNYNNDTIDLLNEYKCKLGFTTIVDVATIDNNKSSDERLKLPRLDTNDLPLDKNSSTNEWFLKGI